MCFFFFFKNLTHNIIQQKYPKDKITVYLITLSFNKISEALIICLFKSNTLISMLLEFVIQCYTLTNTNEDCIQATYIFFTTLLCRLLLLSYCNSNRIALISLNQLYNFAIIQCRKHLNNNRPGLDSEREHSTFACLG